MKIETEKVVYYQLFPYLYDVILKYKDMVNFNFNVQVKKRKVVDTNVETPSKQGFQFKDLKRICVYLHYYDNEKFPFYVGQGTIQRAFNFISRNKLWKDKVKDLSKIKVDIFKIDISVEESINFEKELIDKYKRIEDGGSLVNGNDGDTAIGKSGSENYFYDKHLFGKDNGNYGNKYESNPNSIPILQIDILGNIVKEWSSATEAEEIGGFHSGPIGGCCYGKRHIHAGYQWIFKKDYNPNKNYEYIPGKTNSKIYIAISKAFINNKPCDIKILYGAEDLRANGFNPKNVSQVITGVKFSHGGYKFFDFFKLPKEEKEKYIPLIDITTKI